MAKYLDLTGLELVRTKIRQQHYSKAEVDGLLEERPVFHKFDGVIDDDSSMSFDKMQHNIGKVYFIKSAYVFKRIVEDADLIAKWETCGEPYNYEVKAVMGGGRTGWTAHVGIYYCNSNLYRVSNPGNNYVTIGECQFG